MKITNHSKMTLIQAFVIILLIIVFAVKANAAIPIRPDTTGIVVHHSATVNGNVNAFREYHVNKRGWIDVGYHFVITKEGVVQKGRDIAAVGSHAKGSRNFSHIGICVVGKGSYSTNQLKALKGLINQLKGMYPNIAQVESHHEECPHNNVKKYLKKNVSNFIK